MDMDEIREVTPMKSHEVRRDRSDPSYQFLKP
jgi:hypothetical protein